MKAFPFLLAAGLMTTTAANAAQITFDLTNEGHGESSFSVTEGGVTLTFSNTNATSLSVPVGTFANYNGAVCIFGDFVCTQTTFDFSFDTPVKLVSYTVGFHDYFGSANPIVVTYTPTQADAWVDTITAVGTYNFTDQAVLGAGETVSVSSVNSGGIPDQTDFSAITVEANVPPVPLPGAVWGMIAGIAALGAAARRRKTA